MYIFTGYYRGIPNSKKGIDYRIKLTKNIEHELSDEAFRIGCRNDGHNGVSRNRLLPLDKIIFLILNFKSTVQRELDGFFKAVDGDDFTIRKVTKGAFTQARAKVNPWAFKRLNEVASNTFYENVDFEKWHGYKVLAVDGSTIHLPNHKSVIDEFGVHGFGPKADAQSSLARISLLYDVLNQITLDAEIDKFETGEIDLLKNHISSINKGDLLLLDRGYPCFWLLFLLKAKGIDFCVRLKDNWWKEVNQFVKEDQDEKIAYFSLPKKDKDKLADYPEFMDKELGLRLIKIKLSTGQTEILCTSLTDTKKYAHEEFKELYNLRWTEEEAYKLLKSRAKLEDFSGKTALAVKQDFFAKVFMLTMVASYCHPVQQRVQKEINEEKNNKFDQKINKSFAWTSLGNLLIPLFIKKVVKKSIKAFDNLVYATREIIKPNRSNPRKHKPKKKYNMVYKPI